MSSQSVYWVDPRTGERLKNTHKCTVNFRTGKKLAPKTKKMWDLVPSEPGKINNKWWQIAVSTPQRILQNTETKWKISAEMHRLSNESPMNTVRFRWKNLNLKRRAGGGNVDDSIARRHSAKANQTTVGFCNKKILMPEKSPATWLRG